LKGEKMEKIYEKYAKKVYKYIYALSRNNDVAEEILQETFYSAIKNIKNFKNECSTYTWLCTIARNKWKDYLKHQKKISFVSIYDLPEINEKLAKDNLEDTFQQKEMLVNLHKKIHNLPFQMQEVMLLRLYTNLTFKDISQIFGKTEQWTKTMFYRAKAKIKEEFKDE
jgi:RNA polymerase sigma factor, sigma-70 family